MSLVLLSAAAAGQDLTATGKKIGFEEKFKRSETLAQSLSSAVAKAIDADSVKNVKSEDVAATVIDLKTMTYADVNGDQKIYPASVVKMFYLAAIHRWLEDGKIKLTPELERGLKDMIVDSSNDATHYILDVLTDTSSGGELPEKEFQEWSFKRNAVNRYFSSLGYENINVNQKTYCEDAYGREQQFRNFRGENRNMLTTNATARLLAEIARGEFVSKERSAKMLDLMARDPFAPTKDIDDQAHGFTGIALIDLGLKDAKLYSKAGWTSSTRHDAAYIKTADGVEVVIVVFTKNNAQVRTIIPEIAGAVLKDMLKK